MEPLLVRSAQAATSVPRRSRTRQRGQGLIIFAAAVVFLIGLLAIVVDVTWYWARSLQVQKAADAAALAGAVWLPDQPGTATTVALASAKQNGYVPGAGVTVTAVQDPDRDVQLDTTVSAPVPTFFMHLFGINSLQATRSAKAEYVLPVPMGSPLNYFGAFGDLRGWTYTDTGWREPTSTLGAWSNAAAAYKDESPDPPQYATVLNTSDPQVYRNFHIPMPANASDARFTDYSGIEVQIRAHSSTAGCGIQAEVTSNVGSGSPIWVGATSATNDPAALTSPADSVVTIGDQLSTGASDASAWWRGTGWTTSNFSDGSFGVRLTATGLGACATATTFVDYVRVRVSYQELSPAVTGPEHESLNAQGVWAGILSQGADLGNGDLYAAKKNGSGTNPNYDPVNYYDYAVELRPGTSNGSIYIFDPVFCETANDFGSGMGDNYYGSGSSTTSTFYDLYDTNNTPYTTADDVWVAGSSDLFADSNGTDPSQGGRSASGGRINCQRGRITDPSNGLYWHNRWWPLATGLAGPAGATPRVYRVHVTSTDPNNGSAQASVNTLNNFSLFASVAGHTCPTSPADPACPRVYGLGSMEAFSPLDPSTDADLYLAQIGAVYAGKTLKVTLWDPGDTRPLQADLYFRIPTTTGYQDVSFTWTATRIASGGANCNGSSSGAVTSLRTNNGNTTGLFNGCLVTILIPVPSNYTAPTPPGEPGPGWWKIRYRMGPGSSSASDLTTWKTQLIGNPVHLVVP